MPYSGNWETSKYTNDPRGRGGQWEAEWVRLAWCCVKSGQGEEGRVGVGVKEVPEDGGRIGEVKRAHENSDGVSGCSSP